MPNKRPTIKDVARLAGLSIATVSRYINQAGPVSDAGAQRIQDAINVLHFRPHPAAQALVRSATRSIGLLIPVVSGPFFTPMLRGIEQRLVDAGYALLIHATHPGAAAGRSGVLAEHNTDGLLVFANSLDPAELQRLHALDFPVLLLFSTSPPGLDLPSVGVDNTGGARAVVEHLILEHGCRRILHLHGPQDHADARERRKAYLDTLALHGLAPDPQLLLPGNFDPAAAAAAVRQALAAGLDFDAIFAGDDESASGALQALLDAGVALPEQVRLAGFDDLHLAARLHPALTTVRSPIEEAAAAAAGLLLQRIQGARVPTRTLLPTELVVRRSCGCSFSFSTPDS